MKKFFGIIGFLLFLLGVFTFFTLRQQERLALAKDDKKTSFGIVDGPPFCTWEASIPERVMSEEKSQAVVVQVTNPTSETCISAITLRSPGFDISPVKEEQSITLEKSNKGSISWIITPRKSGTFQIAVSDQLNSKIFGITVTNILGFSAFQAKVASLFGGIFGPMFTLPWWWDRVRGRNKQKPEPAKETSA